uniref:Uncharacterized protein n=1 Tax=Mycena chlorophos TaxID=658473 RepID=A0ABQ0L2Z2_MYCCL|nr:predicted protein [Mycena chlorophos]
MHVTLTLAPCLRSTKTTTSNASPRGASTSKDAARAFDPRRTPPWPRRLGPECHLTRRRCWQPRAHGFRRGSATQNRTYAAAPRAGETSFSLQTGVALARLRALVALRRPSSTSKTSLTLTRSNHSLWPLADEQSPLEGRRHSTSRAAASRCASAHLRRAGLCASITRASRASSMPIPDQPTSAGDYVDIPRTADASPPRQLRHYPLPRCQLCALTHCVSRKGFCWSPSFVEPSSEDVRIHALFHNRPLSQTSSSRASSPRHCDRAIPVDAEGTRTSPSPSFLPSSCARPCASSSSLPHSRGRLRLDTSVAPRAIAVAATLAGQPGPGRPRTSSGFLVGLLRRFADRGTVLPLSPTDRCVARPPYPRVRASSASCGSVVGSPKSRVRAVGDLRSRLFLSTRKVLCASYTTFRAPSRSSVEASSCSSSSTSPRPIVPGSRLRWRRNLVTTATLTSLSPTLARDCLYGASAPPMPCAMALMPVSFPIEVTLTSLAALSTIFFSIIVVVFHPGGTTQLFFRGSLTSSQDHVMWPLLVGAAGGLSDDTSYPPPMPSPHRN